MTVNIEENRDNVCKFAGSFLARVSYKPIRLSLALALPLNFRPVARKNCGAEGQNLAIRLTPAIMSAAPMIRQTLAVCCWNPRRPKWSSRTEAMAEAVTVMPI